MTGAPLWVQAAALPALLPGPATLVRDSPLAPAYQNTSLIYDALATPAPPGPNLTLPVGSAPAGLLPANGTGNATANTTAITAANTTATIAANTTVQAAANVSANTTAVPGGRRRLLQAGEAVLGAFNRSSPVVAAAGRLPPSWLADITACYAVGEYFKVTHARRDTARRSCYLSCGFRIPLYPPFSTLPLSTARPLAPRCAP